MAHWEIVVSGLGDRDTGGGLFRAGDHGLERLDWLASTGLAISPGGDRLARILRTGDDLHAAGEILIYDKRGVRSYHRVDSLFDAHDVIWYEGSWVVASPSSNSLLWLDEAGNVVDRWSPDPSAGDAWHLNCLLVVGGRLLACAFGEFPVHRAWATGVASGAGFVFDVRTGRRVLSGLTYPHHPRYVDGRWLVCNSVSQSVVIFDDGGQKLDQIVLGGWTRGLAVDSDSMYVGCSANRHAQPTVLDMAWISVLERDTLREVERIALPTREVYDVLMVPGELLQGLRRGFHTNPMRDADQSQYALFRAAGVEPRLLWAVSDPLPADACRSDLELEFPDGGLASGTAPLVRYRLVNRGSAILIGAPPNPVNLSWRWFSADGSKLIAEGDRIALPRSLPPNETVTGEFRLRLPTEAGDYLLRASLVQELVHWFDDLDPASGYRQRFVLR